MRPLTLHSSALNDGEYTVYIACMRDLAEDDEPDMQASDTFYEDMKVGVREARAWLRGRYSTLAPGMIDSILRLFCPNLAPADVLTGGQLFAVLRLVHHALNGRDVDKGLVFVQAHPDSQPSPPAPQSIDRLPPPSYDPPSPDKNPFGTSDISKPSPMVPSKSAPLPPAVPPKPSTNPFLARRGSEEGHRPSAIGERERAPNPNARARSEGRTPPLPPRKPTIPVVPSLPPRHSSLAKMPETISVSQTNPHVLIQQSLQATRVAQSLKKAEQRLEQERVWEVLKSSNPSVSSVNGLRRTRSISPTKDAAAPSSSGSSSSGARERPRERAAPTLPPRRKLSPPASTISGATTRSFESVARANIPSSLSRSRHVISPSASATTSPTRTPPRPLCDLPSEPPPTHPDRKPSLPGVDGERSVPNSPSATGEFPRVYRSKSMNHPSPPPPVPPLRHRRPESVQLAPISPVDAVFMSPSRPSFAGTGAHSLSRHHSLSGVPRPRAAGEALPEPIANLQKTLTSLGQKAAPRLDSARYKAEAAFTPRGFVQHSHARPGLGGLGGRWGVREGEERLIDSEEEAVGDGESSVGQDITGDSVRSPGSEEPEWSRRLRRLKMGEGENDGGRESPSRRSFGVERDELKWPAGDGWKRL
ncbi:uncharacterized protein B0H18DRAFT_987818 [Fomitopsis serialis]|uniref:uncharacterized protein n=1 Tax=Fomitopsis serialis TaxID=139415 RepID=UPI00200856DC|nr:uncharacterized protein B0H18DRAFT_987818 [Neoantrodia serialis]KAH9932368.1 hypothetical protein B0H18DRAFT_987818 [Neoantrodia serialis]